MKQNPILIKEICRIICTFTDTKDLLNLALTCRVLYHESCFRLWNNLKPKSLRTLRKIKNTLETTTEEYNKMVWKFCWSAREDSINLERLFFDSFIFPNLRELEFSNASAQDYIVYPMIKAAKLHLISLNLSQCYCLSTDIIKPLLFMPSNKLESLILYGCGKMDPTIMADIINRHSNTLRILRLTDITDTILNAIQNCKKLVDLGLEHCSDQTLSSTALDNFFDKISRNKMQLNQLRLRDIDNLTSQHLKLLANSNTKLSLSHFDMSECNRVNSDGVLCLAVNCTSLSTLLLAYQHGVTDEAMQLFIGNCHYLKHVDVSGCRLLTDQAFLPLIDNGDDFIIPIILETLNVSGLDLLSANTIHQLLTRLPRLQELSLGVTYDLDKADRILEIINHNEIRFYIDIDKYYTICKMPTNLFTPINNTTNNRSLLISTTTTTTTTTTTNTTASISLPSTSTWTLPPL